MKKKIGKGKDNFAPKTGEGGQNWIRVALCLEARVQIGMGERALIRYVSGGNQIIGICRSSAIYRMKDLGKLVQI